jgi:hypothetical protein
MKREIRKTKEDGLVQITTVDERWYQKQSTMDFYKSVTWVCNYVPKGYGFLQALGTRGFDEMERLKKEAGEKGGRVHNAIERLLLAGQITLDDVLPDSDGNEKELTAEEYEAVMSFHLWLSDLMTEHAGDVELLGLEVVGINEEYGFAGTRDIRMRIGQEIWTIDLKTSKDIYPSHVAQLSAYSQFPDALNDKLAILQVGYGRNKKGYKFTVIEPRFDLFLAALTFWNQENANAQPYQRDFPAMLSVSIPKAEGVGDIVVLGQPSTDIFPTANEQGIM